MFILIMNKLWNKIEARRAFGQRGQSGFAECGWKLNLVSENWVHFRLGLLVFSWAVFFVFFFFDITAISLIIDCFFYFTGLTSWMLIKWKDAIQIHLFNNHAYQKNDFLGRLAHILKNGQLFGLVGKHFGSPRFGSHIPWGWESWKIVY